MADTQTVKEIVLAALGAAGPAPRDKDGNLQGGRWHNQVKEIATEIALMTDEHSTVSRAVSNMLAAEKPFVATVLGGAVEASSTRAIIKFAAEKGDGDVEEIRTERTDTADGRAMLARCRALKGHRVLIYKRMEEGSDGKKYRLLQHIVDLGVAEPKDAPAAA